MSRPVPSCVVVGLDVGTTGVKAAVFAPGRAGRRTALREYPLLNPSPGFYVQEPAAILRAVSEALAECVAAAAPAEVTAVSLGAGMHGLLALDDHLRPLTPLVTWADARAREEARELHLSGDADGLHALTGVPVHPMTPLTKLLWFARHDHAVWDAARWWVGLKELVVSWLTGSLVTELSSASATGMLGMGTGTWSGEALELVGLTSDRLPPIEPTTHTLPMAGTAAREVGLPAGTPVVLGAGDGPLGNVGVGALSQGVACLSLGTSGAVRLVVDRPRVDDDRTLFCYSLTDSLWVLGAAVSNGGSVARWAGRTFASGRSAAVVPGGPSGWGDADREVLELVAGVPAGSDGLVMLPYLLPERAPLWDPDLKGAFLGVRREHTPPHFLRAAVEGVGLQMRVVLDGLDRVEPVRSVRATGGVFRSPLWREVVAAAIGRPLRVVDEADGTALGAAAMGLLALGAASSLADAAAQLGAGDAGPGELVEPDRGLVATYETLRASIVELVGQLDRVARAVAPPGDGP